MQEFAIRGSWHIKAAESLMAREGLLKKHWGYEYGVCWNGVQRLYELTGDERYLAYIKEAVDSFLMPDGNIRSYALNDYNLDYVNNGKQLFWLHEITQNEKYLRYAELLLKQLQRQPRTLEGGFWHKQIYPQQMWLDGIYMAQPFHVLCETILGHKGAARDAVFQTLLIHQKTLDESTGLCRHAWDSAATQPWIEDACGRSKHAWGRAMGWYMAAVCDMLEILPSKTPGKGELLRVFDQLAQTLLKYQHKSGVWQQVLDCPERHGNYLESSSSCLIAYAIKKGVRLGLLSDQYLPSLNRAWQGILEQFIEIYKGELVVNKCCVVGGLGGKAQRDGSFEYYMSEPIIMNDLKGVGAFIQVSCEFECD